MYVNDYVMRLKAHRGKEEIHGKCYGSLEGRWMLQENLNNELGLED